MSDAPQSQPSSAEPEEHPVLAIIRRSPRFARMILTGATVGFFLGAVIALGLPGRGAELRSAVVILVAFAFALIGGLSAGAIATRVDSRSATRARHASPSSTAMRED